MTDLEITRPQIEDTEAINEFFKIVLLDTFEKNNISDLTDLIAEEIECKRHYLEQDLQSGGKDRFFLIVKAEGKVIGSIEYGSPNEVIMDCTKGEYKDIKEIGTVFVHPEYQNKGIGSMMLRLMFDELKSKGMNEFCLDSGYKTAQKTWNKKLGTPAYILKDFWGEGADHMIWRVNIENE